MVANTLDAALSRDAGERRPVLGWIGALLARWRTRAELKRLQESGDYLLADIGLDPEVVAATLALPFWRATPEVSLRRERDYSMRKPSRLRPSAVRA